MDTEVVRTFLQIVAEGSFVRAAERLHVAQTTASARIRLLEDALGRQLLTRSKTGVALTPAGQRFMQHATSLVQLWEHARQQVAVPPGHHAMVAVGAELSLWNPWLRNFLIWTKEHAPDIAIRAKVDVPEALMRQVADGSLDLALLYAPQQRPGLAVELIFEERLVLATTDEVRARAGRWRDLIRDDGYVHVEWGPEFSRAHANSFPDFEQPALSIAHGPLALGYILRTGGSAFLRLTAVRPHLELGDLHRVEGAPVFAHPAYAVRSSSAGLDAVEHLIEGLRQTAGRS